MFALFDRKKDKHCWLNLFEAKANCVRLIAKILFFFFLLAITSHGSRSVNLFSPSLVALPVRLFFFFNNSVSLAVFNTEATSRYSSFKDLYNLSQVNKS